MTIIDFHCRCQLDPEGDYIRKYLPQLARMPVEFIYEPWKAPESVQREAGCVIGVDYPGPIVNHEAVSQRNTEMMEELKETLRKKGFLDCWPFKQFQMRVEGSNCEVAEIGNTLQDLVLDEHSLFYRTKTKDKRIVRMTTLYHF